MVGLDKHRVLQILVNLLNNARDAVKSNSSIEHNVSIFGNLDNTELKLAVVDNGVGIEADNLDKIFNFGFTTKEDNHGYGLHTSANAATEMNGSLTVHSNGVGTGAKFTLTIPVAKM